MVQPELHPQDDRREGDGDTSQPIADPTPSGVPEAVVFADPGDENPVTFQTTTDPFARPASFAPAPLPLHVEHDSQQMMRRLEVWRDEFFAWVRTLASAAVYATLIVTFGFQVARVEGQSMAPTLADQDRLIVNKLRYRLTAPQRGDIVMLYYPLNPDKSFVKRVIAEEGDQVRIVDGRVFVNDVPMQDDFVPPEYRSHDDFGPSVIPEGYYFVMGDHRNNSSDSRHWGFVPKKYIIGKVQVRWWPVPHARVFSGLTAGAHESGRGLDGPLSRTLPQSDRRRREDRPRCSHRCGLRAVRRLSLPDRHRLEQCRHHRRPDCRRAAGRRSPLRPSQVRNDGVGGDHDFPDPGLTGSAVGRVGTIPNRR